MSLDTIMVLIAVTGMFATLAIVLGWADQRAGEEGLNGVRSTDAAPRSRAMVPQVQCSATASPQAWKVSVAP
jgi:hypothetical protein